ncbi:kelch domain-containing protein 1-like [Corythoichthys intestinalis]|uniref:kelch domain-containing protein 1-like n=1 Tax=Corythoichthys intestinalis TaxID=161448 RepID=UPI0025A5A61D|nr:kelch domain-containing protein 1-like [Corythoichthys intestinalis]XP_061807160.1 kelch domain-containing protein 1-like [Nerophis lumbriciformis]
MAGVQASTKRLERSGHTAFIDGNNTLYVWGGFQAVGSEDVMLPSDEIWLCDLDNGVWQRREMVGEPPPLLIGFCGSYVNGSLYVFAGYDGQTYSNQMFSVDLTQHCYLWKKVPSAKETTPSPRNKHSCWVHGNRLVYFGGYGCKTLREARNMQSTNFIIEEMTWITIGDVLFRCWGWHNEVDVYDTLTSTWSVPETKGTPPLPRGCHASAMVGNKGYVCGGVERAELDMYCLDLDTWNWTQIEALSSQIPPCRSMHTMTLTEDHTLFVFGGLAVDGETLNDCWQFDTLLREWRKITHPHRDKPRVCHTACLGNDKDVVIFGGSSKLSIAMDSITVLRCPSQTHSGDVLIIQTQPYPLYRLCEDFLGSNFEVFSQHLDRLPAKLRAKIDKRISFFSKTLSPT